MERIESRHGHRQLSYMKELGMGNDRYKLIDTDHGDVEIDRKEAVKDLYPPCRITGKEPLRKSSPSAHRK